MEKKYKHNNLIHKPRYPDVLSGIFPPFSDDISSTELLPYLQKVSTAAVPDRPPPHGHSGAREVDLGTVLTGSVAHLHSTHETWMTWIPSETWKTIWMIWMIGS